MGVARESKREEEKKKIERAARYVILFNPRALQHSSISDATPDFITRDVIKFFAKINRTLGMRVKNLKTVRRRDEHFISPFGRDSE